MAISQFAFIAPLVQKQLTAPVGILGFCANLTSSIPNAHRSGKITVPVVSSMTVSNVVDGTIPANGYASTSVDLTFVDQIVPVKYPPSQWDSISMSEQHMTKIIEAAADALRLIAVQKLVDILIAATPGNSDTLTNGQLNFTTDGTAAEALENIRYFQEALDYLRVTNQTLGNEDIVGILPVESFTNLRALQYSSGSNFVQSEGPKYLLDGVRVYPVTGDSDLAGATEPAFYAFARDTVAIAFGEPEVIYEGAFPDGTKGFLLNGSYAHAVTRANGIAEILNGAS